MKTLAAMFKKVRWLSWAILGFAVVVVLWVVRGLFAGRKPGAVGLPEVPDKLKAKVQKAEEEALVARVEATVEAEQSKKVLDDVAAIEDGAERRRRLAEFIRNQ